MESAELQPLVESLSSNIDDLEEALTPLLSTSLSSSTSKLPLLDKAKLYVLATYTIESILFSTLRLNGINAKSHPVFRELSRVKEYFEKIKTAETVGTKRSTTLDKDAAGRFIKHGLAGDRRNEHDRIGRMARERAGAKRTLEDMQGRGTHTRFDVVAKRARDDNAAVTVVQARDIDDEKEDDEEEEVAHVGQQGASKPTSGSGSAPEQHKMEKKAAKRQRRMEARLAKQSPAEDVGAAAGSALR